ncbi:Tabersonine 6,7-epoxidase isoform 2, variant 2 [Chamberlinius hualienensis]
MSSHSKSTSLIPKKVTMAMTKGRPGSLSSPSFSFRFKNAEDETLEELVEISENNENGDTNEKSAAENQDPSISPPVSPIKSTSKLPIPKIYGKRTQSLDEGSPEHSSTTDTWALLSEIKGKIARTVEEKLHSSGIYRKETKDGTKFPSAKPLSPVEAEEVTEDLDLNVETTKSDSTPFGAVLQRMWSSSESPQLRLRKKEFHTSQSNIEEVVSFSDLLLESSTKGTPKSDNSSPEKHSSLTSIVSEPQKVEIEDLIHENFRREEVEEPETPSEPTEEIAPQNKWQKYKYRSSYITLALLLWYILPSFLSGLILGVAVAVYLNHFWQQLNKPLKYRSEIDKPSTTKLTLPLPSSTDVQPNVIRKVWMNELLSEYSPENYHLSMTESVLVRLDGCALRLSYPKSKVHKRAMWNEAIHESSFIYQRYYDLKGAKVELLPEGLARKRRWSRRYPICIQFSEAPKARDSASIHPHLAKENDKVLVIFARSGRDKEEWFWRFREAILSSSDKLDLNLAAEHRLLQHKLFKYHVYMSRLIHSPTNSAVISSSEIHKQLSHDSDSNSSSPLPSLTDNVDWLNVLMGRCCADVLLDSEENEWIDRISERIQRKLSLIKVRRCLC